MTTITLTLNLPESFAKALAAKHSDGLEAAAAFALKAYVTGGRPQINKERDAAIVRLILDGKRRADIAREFTLSIVRINQIAAEHNVTTQRPSIQARKQTDEKRRLNAEVTQRLMREWSDE